MKRVFCLILGVLLVMGMAVAVHADDAFIGSETNPISYANMIAQTFEHDDQDVGYGFKGWATVYVVNDSDTAWSDFHFSLFQVVNPFGAIFTDAGMGGSNPTYKLNGVLKSAAWSINNAAVGGPTLDMTFNDFVQIGDVATFKVYTNNMATQTKFGLSLYPTSDAVPEPGSILALSSGLLGFAGLAFRKRR